MADLLVGVPDFIVGVAFHAELPNINIHMEILTDSHIA
jgi:hypothetical protein